MPRTAILTYVAGIYQLNPDAEVSGLELQEVLGLDEATVLACVRSLAAEGLVEWDPLLSNVWLRITDLGLMQAEP
jgi:DNA-binding IclR family transcriptional regulator